MFPAIFPTRQDHWDPQGLSDRRACLAIILADVRLRLWGMTIKMLGSTSKIEETSARYSNDIILIAIYSHL